MSLPDVHEFEDSELFGLERGSVITPADAWELGAECTRVNGWD